MGGTKPETPPEEPPWEMPEADVPAGPEGAEEAAAAAEEAELSEVEEGVGPPAGELIDAPVEAAPESEPKLPSWMAEAEAEADAAGPVDAFAGPSDHIVMDWSPGPAEEAEDAPKEAAPPAVEEIKVTIPSPVLKSGVSKPLPMVEAPETVDEEVALGRITEARQLKLMARIDNLLDLIYDRLSAETGQGTLEEVLKLLKTARHTLVENPRDFDTAEYYTHRAKMLLDRFHTVRRDSYGWPGWSLVAYEAVFMLVVALAWVFGERIQDSFLAGGAPEWAVAPWYAMLAGASGGVFGAFWALYKHIANDQDFDRQHTMWYIGSPITGGLAGIAIFFLSHAGALSMGLTNSGGTQAGLVDPNWFLWVVALLAGFKQNVVLDLFARLVKLIEPGQADE